MPPLSFQNHQEDVIENYGVTAEKGGVASDSGGQPPVEGRWKQTRMAARTVVVRALTSCGSIPLISSIAKNRIDPAEVTDTSSQEEDDAPKHDEPLLKFTREMDETANRFRFGRPLRGLHQRQRSAPLVETPSKDIIVQIPSRTKSRSLNDICSGSRPVSYDPFDDDISALTNSFCEMPHTLGELNPPHRQGGIEETQKGNEASEMTGRENRVLSPIGHQRKRRHRKNPGPPCRATRQMSLFTIKSEQEITELLEQDANYGEI